MVFLPLQTVIVGSRMTAHLFVVTLTNVDATPAIPWLLYYTTTATADDHLEQIINLLPGLNLEVSAPRIR